MMDKVIKEYWVIDVTDMNNEWRLEEEILNSNCKKTKVIQELG